MDTIEWLAWARAHVDRQDPLAHPPITPELSEVTLEELEPYFPDGWSANGLTRGGRIVATGDCDGRNVPAIHRDVSWRARPDVAGNQWKVRDWTLVPRPYEQADLQAVCRQKPPGLRP